MNCFVGATRQSPRRHAWQSRAWAVAFTLTGACSVCPEGQWDHDGDPETTCIAWSTCPDGQEEIKPGSDTTDRVCGPSEWTRQFGNDAAEGVHTLVPQDDGVLVSGVIQNANYGNHQFFRRYDKGGTVQVARQLGEATGVDWQFSFPTPLEEVYRVGRWQPDGQGGNRLHVEKLDASGAIAWRTEMDYDRIGTLARVEVDASGNVVVAGQLRASSQDAIFVAKLAPNGDLMWRRTVALDDTEFGGLAVDGAGNVLVGGTHGFMEGTEAFVRKFSPTGDVLWTHEFGTDAFEIVYRVSVGANQEVLVAGGTRGSFPGYSLAGEIDGFLRVLSPGGTHQWTRQLGTAGGYTNCYAVTSSPDGTVYAVGSVSGDLGGENDDDTDAWLVTYDAAGQEQWSEIFATPERDMGLAVAIGPSGEIYLGGATAGTFAGQTSSALLDAFVIRTSAP